MTPDAVSVFTMADDRDAQYVVTHLDGQFLLRTLGSDDEVWQPLDPLIDGLVEPLSCAQEDAMIALIAHEGERFERLLVAQHRKSSWQDITSPTAPHTLTPHGLRRAVGEALLRLVAPPEGLATKASG